MNLNNSALLRTQSAGESEQSNIICVQHQRGLKAARNKYEYSEEPMTSWTSFVLCTGQAVRFPGRSSQQASLL